MVTTWLRDLRHLRRRFVDRWGTWSHLAHFLAVGASGAAVNLAALTGLCGAGVGPRAAVALAIAISLIWNFALNRRFTFTWTRGGAVGRQFVGFAAACSVGMAVNYGVTLLLRPHVRWLQLAAAAGIAAGTGFNFVCARFVVFRRRGAVVRTAAAAPGEAS